MPHAVRGNNVPSHIEAASPTECSGKQTAGRALDQRTARTRLPPARACTLTTSPRLPFQGCTCLGRRPTPRIRFGWHGKGPRELSWMLQPRLGSSMNQLGNDLAAAAAWSCAAAGLERRRLACVTRRPPSAAQAPALAGCHLQWWEWNSGTVGKSLRGDRKARCRGQAWQQDRQAARRRHAQAEVLQSPCCRAPL